MAEQLLSRIKAGGSLLFFSIWLGNDLVERYSRDWRDEKRDRGVLMSKRTANEVWSDSIPWHKSQLRNNKAQVVLRVRNSFIAKARMCILGTKVLATREE